MPMASPVCLCLPFGAYVKAPHQFYEMVLGALRVGMFQLGIFASTNKKGPLPHALTYLPLFVESLNSLNSTEVRGYCQCFGSD